MIDKLGVEEAYKFLYEEAKIGSKIYNQKFIKKLNLTDKRKILDWQIKIVMFSGWGNLNVALASLESKDVRSVVHFENSNYPKSYGSANFPTISIIFSFLILSF